MTAFRKTLCILLSAIILAGVFNASALNSFAYESSDFEYETDGQTVTLTRYTGSSSDVIIPEEIEGCEVVCIIGSAFDEAEGNLTLTVPFQVELKDFSNSQTEKIIKISGYPDSPAFVFAQENSIEFVNLDKNGWISESGKTFYYENGIPVTGLKIINGNTYYFGNDGIMRTGFQTVEESTYYFNSDGKMQFGWYYIGGSWYNFGSDGKMKIGLNKILNNSYYFSENGKMLTGMQTIGNNSYYFRPVGSVKFALKGLDVSTFQKNVDWKKVKAAGYDFAMIRGGYGKIAKDQKDAQFENNYKNAKAAGMPIGVYHYSYARTVADAEKEAAFCLSYLKGKQFEYPIAYDIEDPSQEDLSVTTITNIANTFCSILKEKGYCVAVYSSKKWLTEKIDTKKLQGVEIWVAQWYKEVTFEGNYGIWQYTSKGTVDGISGRVDLDRSYKDYSAIIKLSGLNGYSLPDFNTVADSAHFGEMATGWQIINNKKFFFNSKGVMQTGWQDIKRGDGKTYRHYFGKDGAMLTGIQSIDGKKYIFDTNGCMLKGWQSFEGNTYRLGSDGVMLTGLQNIKRGDGKTYRHYFGKDGVLRSGFQTIDGKKYLFDSYGRMKTGWQTVDGKKYRFNSDGVMLTGWKSIKRGDGKIYRHYFGSNGVLRTGWQKIKRGNGITYMHYFDSYGRMKTGWQKIKNADGKICKYYFDSYGRMKTGRLTVGGKVYCFDSNGVLK